MPLLYHHLLLLVAAWLAVSGCKPTAAAGAEYLSSDSICQKSFKCGDHIDIHYPFYLSTNYECGYPGMAISCDERGTATLQLGGGSEYTVLAINYGNNTISLADTDFMAAAGGCTRVRRNVTFPPVNSFETTPDSSYSLQLAIDYLSFFYDCTFTASLPRPVGIVPINCSSFEQGPSPSFSSFEQGPSLSFLVPQLDTPEGDWFIRACKEVYVVPVLGDELFRPEYYSQLGSTGYGQVLKAGFQLSWIGPKGDWPCHQCELSNGQCSYDRVTGGFLGCLCSDGRVRNPDCGGGHMKKTRKIYIIASTSSILVLCLLLFSCLLGCKRYRSRKKSKETPRIESFLQKHAAIHSKRYTYSQVKRMTRNFAEKLGQGGFGVVYRGDLSGGRQIAVKMLKDSKADVEEFINEVASISRTSHVNVVTLLGFCLEGSKRALIYDYMPNGSLERYAFKCHSKGENILSWEKLFDIAVGIARGLEYLHRGCNIRIVHFDIKPHNILLDQDFCPKISDFGLAKLCPNKESAISIGDERGTIGYIAPEVYSKQFGAVSSKSDVYSYGMMVLEMVGARDKNINAKSECSSQYFPEWIYKNLDEYCISASEIDGNITEIVRKMIVVALWCIQLSASNRPTMTRVVEMLEGNTNGLELPPQVLLSL